MKSKPDFLVIGAMKAGTTTLYRDLFDHPDIFLGHEKEPDTLVKYGDDLNRIEEDYMSLFNSARDTQLTGECSTSYAKRPEYVGVSKRLKKLCGNEVKIIYIRRDPVKRALSHYAHDYGLKYIDCSPLEAFVSDPSYLLYGCYQWQLEPWRQDFPAENILVLDFEEYISNRKQVLGRICEFLDVDAGKLADPDLERSFNKSDGKPIPVKWLKKLIYSRFYQRIIKPIVPWSIRDFLHRKLSPRARPASNLDDQKLSVSVNSMLENLDEFHFGK